MFGVSLTEQLVGRSRLVQQLVGTRLFGDSCCRKASEGLESKACIFAPLTNRAKPWMCTGWLGFVSQASRSQNRGLGVKFQGSRS